MMFTRIISSLFGITALSVAFVAAGPVRRWDHVNSPASTTSDSCNGKPSAVSFYDHQISNSPSTRSLVGEAQCCQTIHQNNDQSLQFVTSLLGLSLPADGLMAGLQCSPIANLASLGGSSSCNSHPVCCTGNT